MYSSHQPIGPQLYIVIFEAANEVYILRTYVVCWTGKYQRNIISARLQRKHKTKNNKNKAKTTNRTENKYIPGIYKTQNQMPENIGRVQRRAWNLKIKITDERRKHDAHAHNTKNGIGTGNSNGTR